tara:strand:- start:151 stop:393 length:243 start_codon:yes stop_codon:yes gene_type:complete
MDKGKIFTLILWAVLAINYSVNFSVWINYFAILLLAIHLLEFIFFFKKIKNSEDSLINGFVQTLIFGVLYIGNLKEKESF